MSDLISRQAAISAICNACGKIDCDKMDKCEKLQLQPANCSEFPNNSDTISRQAAIDALRTCYDTETITMDNGDEYINYGDAVGEIEQLPSTQPEPQQVAKDIARIVENEQDMRVIAQPERIKGHWIKISPANIYECSECGKSVMTSDICAYDFCHGCGADMREVTT